MDENLLEGLKTTILEELGQLIDQKMQALRAEFLEAISNISAVREYDIEAEQPSCSQTPTPTKTRPTAVPQSLPETPSPVRFSYLKRTQSPAVKKPERSPKVARNRIIESDDESEDADPAELPDTESEATDSEASGYNTDDFLVSDSDDPYKPKAVSRKVKMQKRYQEKQRAKKAKPQLIIYDCGICHDKFDDSSKYNRHMRQHTVTNLFSK